MTNYIAINGFFLNLSAIATIEDTSEPGKPSATVTTVAGAEIEIEGDDADRILKRVDMLAASIDIELAKLQEFAAQVEASANQTS